MADNTTTPNMSLVNPTVGSEPGPNYANDISGDLVIIDAHNHTPGSGVQIPTDAIDINADLSFNLNNITDLNSIEFANLASVLSSTYSLYVSGGVLYFNNGTATPTDLLSLGPGNISSAGQFLVENSTNTASLWTTLSGDIQNSTSTSGQLTVVSLSTSSTLPITPSLQFQAATSSPTINQVQNTSGAGTSLLIEAQQGYTGFNGGNITVQAGAAGSSAEVAGTANLISSTKSQLAISPTGAALTIPSGGTWQIDANSNVVETWNPYAGSAFSSLLQKTIVHYPFIMGTSATGGLVLPIGTITPATFAEIAIVEIDALSEASGSGVGGMKMILTLDLLNNPISTLGTVVVSNFFSAASGPMKTFVATGLSNSNSSYALMAMPLTNSNTNIQGSVKITTM